MFYGFKSSTLNLNTVSSI